MDIDVARWGAIEKLILEGMRKLQQAHLIMNHMKAEHGFSTKEAPTVIHAGSIRKGEPHIEEPECIE